MPSQLSDLVSKVSSKLGEVVEFEFFTETAIKQALGDSFRFYTMQMVALGTGYFEETILLDITGGVETVSVAALTPPFWKVSLIEKIITNARVPLKPYKRRYETLPLNGVGSGTSYLPTYKMRGMSIVLEPPPRDDELQTLKLDYVYIPEFPSGSTVDTFQFDEQFPDAYEVNAILRACIKLLEEKDAVAGVSDAATFRQELAALDEIFNSTIAREEIPDDIAYLGIDYSNPYE